MILMRISLFAVGAAFGAIAMWQILDAILRDHGFSFPMPSVPFFYIATALLFGGIGFLSAKMLRSGFSSLAKFFRRKDKQGKLVDVAGIVVGLLVGIAIALAIGFILRALEFNILALEILISIAFGLTTAFITAILISSWLNSDKASGSHRYTPLKTLETSQESEISNKQTVKPQSNKVRDIEGCCCPNIECEHHGVCHSCIKRHQKRGNLPHCLRGIRNKKEKDND